MEKLQLRGIESINGYVSQVFWNDKEKKEVKISFGRLGQVEAKRLASLHKKVIIECPHNDRRGVFFLISDVEKKEVA